MVTLSFFTSPVPLEDLGALTWPTINKPRFREGKSSAEYVVTVDLKADEAQVANAYGPKGEGNDRFHTNKSLLFSLKKESVTGQTS